MPNVKRIPYIGSLVFLVYMPLHIFLAQSLSLLTGGLDVWKVAKDVVLLALVLFTICLVIWQGKVDRTFKLLVGFTVIYGALHLGLWATHPHLYQRSAILGVTFNMRVPLFVILGYSAARLWPKFVFSSVIKVVLFMSTLVAFLGIVQYFLPHDIMTHLGYSIARGARPFFQVDTNGDLIRIMSTVREPNALGAYLVLPSVTLLTLLFRADRPRRKVLAGLLAVHVAAILLTLSRSAWLGLALAVGVTLWWQFRERFSGVVRRFWPVIVLLFILLGAAGYAARGTATFQRYAAHSNPHPNSEQIADPHSNGYHIILLRQGLRGIVHEPFGNGPGTAGLASIQNPHGGQLTENYYVQIAYEVGVLGGVLFIGFNVWIYMRLRRRGDYVAIILGASFWAYVVTNMLLHTWSNEAVATQWWILAGMALAPPAIKQLSDPPSAKKRH